jgi:hypothetical protein
MHNLFGDTNVVHVDLDEAGRPRLTHVLRGERVQDVLEYVEYFEPDLLSNLRRSVEKALEDGRITFEESALLYRRYEAGLHGYTYLTRERRNADASQGTPTNGTGAASAPPAAALPASVSFPVAPSASTPARSQPIP